MKDCGKRYEDTIDHRTVVCITVVIKDVFIQTSIIVHTSFLAMISGMSDVPLYRSRNYELQ